VQSDTMISDTSHRVIKLDVATDHRKTLKFLLWKFVCKEQNDLHVGLECLLTSNRTTRRYIPEDRTFQKKSFFLFYFLFLRI
jgi:hypothetical protein